MSFFKKLFGLERATPNHEGATGYLTTAQNNAELAAIEAILRAAELPYRVVDRDGGGVSRTLAGYTMYGTDIYVRPEDVEAAKELLAPAEEIEEGNGADE